MPVASELQIFGIQEALKTINDFDKTYRRQITKDIQNGAGKAVVTEARALIPTDYPLPGMSRGSMIAGRTETAYRIGRAEAGVKTIVARRASKERTVQFRRRVPGLGTVYTEPVDFKARPFALLVAQQKDAAAAIWDHAGMVNTSDFVTNLVARGEGTHRQAPRALAPGVAAAMPTVETEVSKILDAVSDILNKELKIERRG
jgi:hypothetical protein